MYCSVKPSKMAQFVIVLVVLACVGRFHLVSSLSLEKEHRGRHKVNHIYFVHS